MIKKIISALAASAILVASSAIANVEFSGFASINAGKVLSGDGVPKYDLEPSFLADYPIASTYNDEWSFKPESLLALQVNADLGNKLSATAQILSRGSDDWGTKLEWAYISYEINDQWTVEAGKKRIPLFYYSDFYDVGYAYAWMRLPADIYTWQILNYNGINALYNGEINDWAVSANIYTGREDSNKNKLLSDYFFHTKTSETWKDIIGATSTINNDWLEIRLSHMQYTNERTVDDEKQIWNGKDSRDGRFTALATNMDFGTWFLFTEVNQLDLVDEKIQAAMISSGYRFDNFTPFIGYSFFDTKDVSDGEKHTTTFTGLRWDFHTSASLKVQLDKVNDKSYKYTVAGDSTAISFGIDLLF